MMTCVGITATLAPMKPFRQQYHDTRNWLLHPQRKQKAAELSAEVNRAFTEHPQDTGETYWQHLWFTITMAGRFLYAITVLTIHGLFPFLLTRAGSRQIEAIYSIMKSRIPKARRDEIDLDYSV